MHVLSFSPEIFLFKFVSVTGAYEHNINSTLIPRPFPFQGWSLARKRLELVHTVNTLHAKDSNMPSLMFHRPQRSPNFRDCT